MPAFGSDAFGHTISQEITAHIDADVIVLLGGNAEQATDVADPVVL